MDRFNDTKRIRESIDFKFKVMSWDKNKGQLIEEDIYFFQGFLACAVNLGFISHDECSFLTRSAYILKDL